ncbi:MAG: glycosyltransferase [Nitrospirae bacterium]|nr:glycosyltransferase [Nitrospirota bacterium]
MQTLIFSIIIPTYNRRDAIERCLHSLSLLDYPASAFEIIVVDDGGGHPISDIIDRFKENLNISLIRQNNSGPASARNAGASIAKGKYLLFTDDDCTSCIDLLRKLEIHINSFPKYAIGGKTLNALTENIYSKAQQVLLDYLFVRFNKDKITFLTSSNLTVDNSTFKSIGGFNGNFKIAGGEDRDFCRRLRASGCPLVYASEAQVYHYHPLSLLSFAELNFRYGRGAYLFRNPTSSVQNAHVAFEPFKFYLNLVLHHLKSGAGLSRIAIALLLLISQAANAFGFVLEAVIYCTHRGRKNIIS